MSQYYYVLGMNFIFYLIASFSKSFQCVFELTLLPGFKRSYCISVTFNNFAESKREQSLAFCLSIIMCMNFIFYLVVGFPNNFILLMALKPIKCAVVKKMHLSSSTAQRVRASLKTYIKRRACSINYSKCAKRWSDENIQKIIRQSTESLHTFFSP